MAATARTNSDTLDATNAVSTPLTTGPVVLDLGKRRRKLVKQLRRGEGKLLDDINGAVEELKIAGTLSAATQPVIVIVREKRGKAKSLFPLL
jgi:hypothetical protein